MEAVEWRSQKFTVQFGRNTRKFFRKNSLSRCSTTFIVEQKDNEEECLGNARLVPLHARRFGKGQRSFIGRGSGEEWYSISEDSPQGIWDKIAQRMLLEFAESGCPIFPATTPLSRGQLRSKGHGKLSIHIAATQETIETIFRTIVSANQLSLYGAVAEMCDEYEAFHERTGRPVVMGQWSSSLVVSVIKTEVPVDSDDPAFKFFYCNNMETIWEAVKTRRKWVNSWLMQDFVENGQYFMTKDTRYLNLIQWLVVTTLFQGITKKDGSKGTP